MRPERLFLTDILEACDEIAAFIAGYDLDSFVADSKTRSATLLQFVIIGEAANRTSPDLRARYADVRWRDAIDLRNYAAHTYLRGVDVYDPTTGQIRSSSTADIACWFIDTDYNAESFFVRHAYFTGADEPYDKLKRALRSEIDEAAWSALYSTTSRPFWRPASGQIAVKVINHYGDEVLKVYAV